MASFYRDLTRILRKAGCIKVREAKGSHEYWQSPVSGKRFPVPANIKYRGLANAILRQAGIPKSF